MGGHAFVEISRLKRHYNGSNDWLYQSHKANSGIMRKSF
jgi:hypothetical protein